MYLYGGLIESEIRRIPYISHDLIDYERFANLKNLYSEEEEFYKLFITQHSYEPYFIAPRLSPLYVQNIWIYLNVDFLRDLWDVEEINCNKHLQ